MSELSLTPGNALVIVDVQNDFLPGGALPVPDGDEIIPILNRYIRLFHLQGLPIVASRDYHPARHCSFLSEGGSWPPHCIAGTTGAELASALQIPADVIMIDKAVHVEKDAYSVFQGTTLQARLQKLQVNTLSVGGLATNYCILHSVKDAEDLGYQVFLLTDAIRAVNLKPNDGDRALSTMIELGAIPVTVQDICP